MNHRFGIAHWRALRLLAGMTALACLPISMVAFAENVCRRTLAIVTDASVDPVIVTLSVQSPDSVVTTPAIAIPLLGWPLLIGVAAAIVLATWIVRRFFSRAVRQGLILGLLFVIAAATVGDRTSRAILPSPPAQVDATPSEVSFDPVQPGTSGAPHVVQVTNHGSTPVQVLDIGVPPDFLVQNHCGAIGSGQSCEIEIRYAPQAAATCAELPAPVIVSIDPATIVEGTRPASIHLAGSGFQRGAVVRLDAITQRPDSVAAGDVVFASADGMTTPAREIAVSVRNPDGRLSNSVGLAIVAANLPPLVSIAQPVEGASLPAGSPITVTASASDADGSIARVELFDSSTSLGVAGGSTFSWTWNGATLGNHTLTAIATDDQGASTTSQAVHVSVVSTADTPDITITSHVDGQVIDAQAITLAGVTRRIVAMIFPTECRAVDVIDNTFSIANVAVYYGDNALTVNGSDADGGRLSRSIVLRNTWPSLEIVTPTDHTISALPLAAIEGRFLAPDGSTVTLSRSGLAAPVDARIAGMRFMGEIVLAPGNNTVTATLTTPSGDKVVKAISLTRADAGAHVAIKVPAMGTFIEAPEVDIVGTYTAPPGSTISVNGYFATLDNGAFTIRVPVDPGLNDVVATLNTPTGGLAQALTRIVNSFPYAGPINVPLMGATTAIGNAMVAGIAIGPDNSSITINGIPATVVSRRTFAAYYAAVGSYWSQIRAVVPIVEGDNLITLQVVTPKGSVASKAIHVNGSASVAKPAVAIVSPADHAELSSSQIIKVAASSTNSRLTFVELWENGALAQSHQIDSISTTETFEYYSKPPGVYILTARAVDRNGSIFTSAPITLTKSAPPSLPTVAITSPVQGSHYLPGAPIHVAVDATVVNSTIKRVDILDHDTALRLDVAPPFAFDWLDAAIGSHSLKAKATSAAGQVATSGQVTIQVDQPANQPPTVTLNAPRDGQTFPQTMPIDLIASATDADGTVAKVDFLDGENVLATAWTAPYNYTWADATPGTHALSARATDDHGATATSAPASISVTPVDDAAPSIKLKSPISGEAFAFDETITLEAEASDIDGSINRVVFFDGPDVLAIVEAPPYRWTWSHIAPGVHSITAIAIDNRFAGTQTPEATVTVNPQPVLALDGDLDGASFESDFITISGTVIAPANAGVMVNGLRAVYDRNGHFFAPNVPLMPGANSVTATLTADDGKTVTRTISLTSAGNRTFLVSATPQQGFAPLASTIRVFSPAGVAVDHVEFDFDGNGTVDATRNFVDGVAEVEATFPAGTFFTKVAVKDADGNTIFASTQMIYAYDPASLDALLQGVWRKMNAALVAGDKPRAMLSLNLGAQDKYGPVFDSLLPYMPDIVASYSLLQPVSVDPEMGEYAVNRTIDGTLRIFLLYLLQDDDGVWRMDSM